MEAVDFIEALTQAFGPNLAVTLLFFLLTLQLLLLFWPFPPTPYLAAGEEEDGRREAAAAEQAAGGDQERAGDRDHQAVCRRPTGLPSHQVTSLILFPWPFIQLFIS